MIMDGNNMVKNSIHFFKSQQDLHRTIPIDYKIYMNV